MYVISYDITDTKRRNKIFKLLKNYGRHKQYSVFECDLTKKRFEKLYKELVGLMDEEEEGNIRIYHLCQTCSESISVIGIGKEAEEEEKEETIVI